MRSAAACFSQTHTLEVHCLSHSLPRRCLSPADVYTQLLALLEGGAGGGGAREGRGLKWQPHDPGEESQLAACLKPPSSGREVTDGTPAEVWGQPGGSGGGGGGWRLQQQRGAAAVGDGGRGGGGGGGGGPLATMPAARSPSSAMALADPLCMRLPPSGAIVVPEVAAAAMTLQLQPSLRGGWGGGGGGGVGVDLRTDSAPLLLSAAAASGGLGHGGGWGSGGDDPALMLRPSGAPLYIVELDSGALAAAAVAGGRPSSSPASVSPAAKGGNGGGGGAGATAALAVHSSSSRGDSGGGDCIPAGISLHRAAIDSIAVSRLCCCPGSPRLH